MGNKAKKSPYRAFARALRFHSRRTVAGTAITDSQNSTTVHKIAMPFFTIKAPSIFY